MRSLPAVSVIVMRQPSLRVLAWLPPGIQNSFARWQRSFAHKCWLLALDTLWHPFSMSLAIHAGEESKKRMERTPCSSALSVQPTFGACKAMTLLMVWPRPENTFLATLSRRADATGHLFT